ncbi:hypothetical protein KSC_009270 [Ktedonobacter sp. SOSP1-52]|uniref:PrgI family mobile element protein n=1 Tax=Ktedonobacter sp. SOSP1-52 TaxID=2778366 RepID=UPI0019153528|nr:PrgI family protein [Ktedonobacter sp. SOSP1-52]GHO62035.1 hypothetical protein KSC_009270 [Ktedonobacter sp. SOSP1-52]
MQKEEIPTFLNEQPKVIFGRTGRELLIIVCGIVGGYSLWGNISPLVPGAWWAVASVIIACIPALLALVVAMVPIAERPLEEWAMCWLLYMGMPRVFIYKPLEDDDTRENPALAEAQKKTKQQMNEEEEDLLE